MTDLPALRSWAGGHFCAAHRDPNGVMHGHTWRVRAFWPYADEDIRDRRDSLRRVLAMLDHTTLPDELSRAESIAAWIGARLGFAVRVDVWREEEDIGAVWPG